MQCEGCWCSVRGADSDAVQPCPLQLSLGVLVAAVQDQHMEVGLLRLRVLLDQRNRRGGGVTLSGGRGTSSGCTCSPKSAFPFRKCPLAQLGEMRSAISASSRALHMPSRGSQGKPQHSSVNDVMQWCTSLFIIPEMFITEGPVSVVSARKTGDISSPISVPLPATSNAQASHAHLSRPPNLWSCEYKLIASSNFATASAYCWDTAKRLACAGERRGEEGREEEGRGGLCALRGAVLQ